MQCCGRVQGKHISIPSVVPGVMNIVTDIAVFGVNGISPPLLFVLLLVL